MTDTRLAPRLASFLLLALAAGAGSAIACEKWPPYAVSACEGACNAALVGCLGRTVTQTEKNECYARSWECKAACVHRR